MMASTMIEMRPWCWTLLLLPHHGLVSMLWMEAVIYVYVYDVMSQCFAPKRRYEKLWDPKDKRYENLLDLKFWREASRSFQFHVHVKNIIVNPKSVQQHHAVSRSDYDTPSPHRPLY
jgi:hypothetical protein